MSTRELLFIVSNVGITLGYIFMAAVVVPRVTLHLKRTRYGGIGFFLLCGLHHLDGVFHVIFQSTVPVGQVMVEWHMLLIDIPQAISVWAFVTGLYLELVKWGPWGQDEQDQ